MQENGHINLIDPTGYSLNNLGKINIILGKNGCGKSTLLKSIENYLFSLKEYGKIKYITPERGGVLIYDPSTEINIATNPNWMTSTRRANRLDNFRQQSVCQFRNLELLFLRDLDENQKLRNDINYTFSYYINRINQLLDNIEIRRYEASFKIYKKGTNEEINPNNISSGESELISLGIECLVFEQECLDEKPNILFLDEPDVHLHPDLQARLSHFLCELVINKNAIIIIATHSTALFGALEDFEDTSIEFMISGQKVLNFKKISDEYRRILPIFGAHPLSNLFNQVPIFLVEGEDDERIWQQAVRSANKKLKIYPCSTDGIDKMKPFEKYLEQIINSVYENAKAFSLRDRDDGSENINNLKNIKRFKLSCRASENLMLTNEVLAVLEISWEDLKQKIIKWLETETQLSHPQYQTMNNFRVGNFDRKNFKLKEIRNIIMGLTGKSIAWEIAVGKTIGQLINKKNLIHNDDKNSLYAYLGDSLINSVIAK